MIFAPHATPALNSSLQMWIEAAHPEAATLCKAYRSAESSRRFHRTIQRRHPEDVSWAANMERQDAAAARDAASTLHRYLTGRGETPRTVSTLIDEIGNSIVKEWTWYNGRAKAEITEWFRPGMTHSEFASIMSGGPFGMPHDAAVEMWRGFCPNMTLAEVYHHFDSELDYVLPDTVFDA